MVNLYTCKYTWVFGMLSYEFKQLEELWIYHITLVMGFGPEK